MAWEEQRARTALRAMFDAAVASADPHRVLAQHLPPRPTVASGGRVVVVGAGKSAATMAAALEAAWPGVEGVVVTRYGHSVPTARIRVIESAHPVPDDNSVLGAQALLDAVQGLGPSDLVLALMSGGASALIERPAPGLTLADLARVNRALLASGAGIHEMNAVRKHLSAIKGGRLALAAAPAQVITLVISDVPGDDPAVIGSGPTVSDPSTWADVHAIAARYGLDLPLHAGAEMPAETPKTIPADVRLIATPSMALAAAADAARAHGLTPLILGDALEGESQQLGTVMAGIAHSVRAHGHPLPGPCVLLSGGETTVTIGAQTPGRGGRNTEFLLGLALGLRGAPGIWALAGDTDGIDGTEDAAGAFVTPHTLGRAREAGLDPRAVLVAHDSYGLFDAVGDLLRTGPTLTNVNDLRAILVA